MAERDNLLRGECEEVQETPVSIALKDIDSSIDHLQHTIDFLRDKVAPAMTPNTPVPPRDSAKETQESPSSDLKEDLRTKSNRISIMAIEIESMTSRIEL